MDSKDRAYLSRTFTLARLGSGKVSPNPEVGCVIVKGGKIISSGYHRKFGGDHAEVDAIKRSSESVEGATLYVSLEPCSHYGKTPPCVDLVIANKISRVVIGMPDPNPLVSGSGIRKMRDAGIEVEVSDFEEHRRFYRKFTRYITSPYPFITIKSAITLDGKIAEGNGKSKWITNETSRAFVHKLRSENDAILTTSATVRADDPMMNVRGISGTSPGRVMLSSHLFFDEKLNFFRNEDKKSIVIASEGERVNQEIIGLLEKNRVEVIFVKGGSDGRPDVDESLVKLHQRGIASVMIEAGSVLISELVNRGLFDEMVVFIAPKLIGPGISVFGGLKYFGLDSPVQLKLRDVKNLDGDAVMFLEKV